MSKKLLCILCVWFSIGQAISQSNETYHTFAQIFNDKNELVSSLSQNNEEAKGFDFERYILDNKEVAKLNLMHTTKSELEVERHIYRTVQGAQGEHLCKSTEVSASPILGVAVTSTPNFHGVKVLRVVDGGPADQLGIRVDDVLYTFEDTELSSHCDLQMAVRKTSIGTAASLQYSTDGISKKDNIIVGAQTINTHNYTLCDKEEIASEQEVELESTLTTYPNPTRSSSFINYKSEDLSPIQFKIIDMNGAVIHSEEFDHFSSEIRLEYRFEGSAQPGVYLFVIEQGAARHYNKVLFVKE